MRAPCRQPCGRRQVGGFGLVFLLAQAVHVAGIGQLAQALRSVFAQRRLADRPVRVVVVDNDPEGTAWEVVRSLEAESPFPMAYVVAPKPGVATAGLQRM